MDVSGQEEVQGLGLVYELGSIRGQIDYSEGFYFVGGLEEFFFVFGEEFQVLD